MSADLRGLSGDMGVVAAYLTAKETVIERGYAGELDWQHDLDFDDVTESSFLREIAWVILSAGMKEAVIRNRFPAISHAFRDWASAAEIVSHRVTCRRKALLSFGHERKTDAIIEVACEVACRGFEEVKRMIRSSGIGYISTLPFMGPATSYHLAKNLGLQVVKPDRHLVRVAKAAGYSSPHSLCADIAREVGDKLSVVDLVIWRYATLNRGYLALFTRCNSGMSVRGATGCAAS